MKKIFLLPIFFLLLGSYSHATHIIGGNLKYECIADQVYKFTLTVYSECGAVAKLDPRYNIFFFSPSLGIKQSDAKNFHVNQFEEKEEIIFCPSQLSNCNSGGTGRGIKRVIYTGTINLKAYGKAKDWTFYWKKSYRSEEINTLVLAEEEDFFIKVQVDNSTVACNKSPHFESNPVITACIGEVRTFNPVAIDPEGDVLVYSLVPPLNDFDVEVTYNNGFSYTNFISLESSIQINSTTGDITFKPTVKDQVGITDIMVKEYRNGVLISTVVSSLQVTTLDCNNKAPVLSNFVSNQKDSVAVYAGDLINIQINGSDPDGQNVTMKLLNGKQGVLSFANNTTTLPTGNFVWQTYYFEAGKYLFTVELKDGGCPRPQVTTKTYIIEVLPRFIKVAFEEDPRCEDIATLFKDKSISYNSTITGSLNSWKWDFGDGGTSKIQNPSHTFANAGKYKVKLVVGSAKGYKDSVEKEVTICGMPVFNFQNIINCSYNTKFEDNTPEFNECMVEKRVWHWGDGDSSTVSRHHCYPRIGDHNYGVLPGNVPKEYDVTLTIVTTSGCRFKSPPIKVFINPSPIVDIIENEVVFDCANPSVTLHSQILSQGAGGLTYLWSTGATTPDININTMGSYTLRVTAKDGCYSEDVLNVVSPIKARFKQSFFCSPGKTVRFTDMSIVKRPTKPVTKWEWDFGDGTKSTDQNPDHKYATSGNYLVKLKITDGDNCRDSISHVIYNTYFTDRFEVPTTPICVNNPVYVKGPSFSSTEHFEFLEWDFGNGRKAYTADAQTDYKTPGKYTISLKVVYNKQSWNDDFQPCVNSSGCYGTPQSCFDTQCDTTFIQEITVNPELRVEIDPFRVCRDEAVSLSFKRVAGDLSIPIINAEWEIRNVSPKNVVTTEIIKQLNPTHTFKEGANRVVLTVQDALGCKFTHIPVTRSTEIITIPIFTYDTVCAGEVTTLTANFKDIYENIQEVKWDFGNNDIVTRPYKRPLVEQKTFSKGGIYPIKLTAYTFIGCSQTYTQDVLVLDQPKVDFSSTIVCAMQPVEFTNTTNATTQKIISYLWDFADGSISTEENPMHAYEKGGTYNVKLTAVSEAGCSGFIEKKVYIKDKPVADFTTEEELPAAYTPIHFLNKSEGNIKDYHWDFGDGTFSDEMNPIHTYDSVRLYKVTLTITSHEGCSDTIVKKNNLNVHAELPSAFSPNGDGNNDVFSILSNGIKELHTFKIYNRWGELVFDAGNNLSFGWDGTFRGKPQEVGVYVVYINALGMYDTIINYKMNITLLR